MTRRVVSLWLPRVAVERALRRDPALASADGRAAAAAVVGDVRGAARLTCLNRVAEQAGLARGMSLADARAIRPDLRTAPASPEADAAFWDRLQRWALRFSPWVGRDGADQGADGGGADAGLALDVSGCAHLFGGEAALLQEMTGRLDAMGLTARAGLAETKGAAWALARFGPEALEARIAAPGQARAALADLPIAALRLSDVAATGLLRVGVRTVRDLAGLPRASLARRFGVETVRRLDQAFGQEPEPVAPARPPTSFAARLSLPDPIGLAADVGAALDRVLARLCERLAQEGVGARRLRLSLKRVDRAEAHLEVGLARPGREPARIRGLFDRGLAEIDAAFGIDAVRLEAIEIEPLSARQRSGLGSVNRRGDGLKTEDEALDELIARLGNRLGFDRTVRFAPADSHIPEKAFLTLSAAQSDAAEPGWRIGGAGSPPRPVALLTPEPVDAAPTRALETSQRPAPARAPAAFRWRGAVYKVAAADGPERIAPEWWLDDPAWRAGLRDYWRVQTEEGPRFWLFHTPQSEGRDRWFLQGLFD